MSIGKDYYNVLGVPEDATESQIKQSYRKLARQYHPDKNPGDKAAEQRFKEISEAHEVLANPEKRKQYDMLRKYGGRGGVGFDPSEIFGRGGRPGGGQPHVRFEDLGDLGSIFSSDLGSIFSNMFGGGAGGSDPFRSTPNAPQRGDDMHIKLDVPFEVAAKGGKSRLRLKRRENCHVCGGSGSKQGGSQACPSCDGRGQVQEVQGNFAFNRPCPRCFGRGTLITDPCAQCGGSGTVEAPRELSVSIPAGVTSGKKIRLAGEGHPGKHGAPRGNLYIEINVQPHKDFTQDGNNIVSEARINLKDALLGTKLPVKTLKGEVTLTVPPGVAPGSLLRIKGHGIAGAGDHLVKNQVALPKKLSGKQRKLFEQFWQAVDGD